MEVEKVPDQTHLGVSEPEWKERLGNHKQDWKKPDKRGATCLSKYIWSLKDKGLVQDRDWTISWALMARAKAFSPSSGYCRLCIKEKSLMILNPDTRTSYCSHQSSESETALLFLFGTT